MEKNALNEFHVRLFQIESIVFDADIYYDEK